jgi:uncharacterized protein DUF4345
MRRAFQVFPVLFGVIVIAIGAAHLAVGPAAIIGGSDVNPTSDGEDRFYAGMFLRYGLALLWCSRDVQRRRAYIKALAFAFLVGGIGRLLSLILVGAPHPFFIAMLVLELVLPPLMVFGAKRAATPS